MLGASVQPGTNETPAEKYQRIFNLYKALDAELVQLKSQGDKLVAAMHDAIDKEKIADVLKKLHN